MPGEGHGGPARGYSWPPFAPGHTLTLKHGARSPRTYLPVARELAAGLLAERPYLADYPEAVAAWSENEARADLLRRWLGDHELLDEAGLRPDVGGAMRWLRWFDARARELRRDLGLDPHSDAQLATARATAANLSADLEGVRQAGRAALEARERVEVLSTSEDTGAGGTVGSGDPGGPDDA